MSEELVWGRHPVVEVLRSGKRKPTIIYIAHGTHGQGLAEIKRLGQEQEIPIKQVPVAKLNDLARQQNHQGVIAISQPICYASLQDIWAKADKSDPLVLICDNVQDPYNLGNLIRSAEVLGAHGIIIPSRRAAGISPAVGKSACGALEYLPVVRVTNIVATMAQLKKHGLWLAGCIAETGKAPWHTDLRGPLGIIVGNEGLGLRRLVQDKCDYLITIPQTGKTASLNVGAAAAIAIAEAVRQRNG